MRISVAPTRTSTQRSFGPRARSLNTWIRSRPATPNPRARFRAQARPAMSATMASSASVTSKSPPPAVGVVLAAGAANRGACTIDIRASRRLLELANAFGGTHDIGDADAELFVDHHDFAVRHQRAVDEHIERFAG